MGLGQINDKETAMTQVTMPDLAAPRENGATPERGGHGADLATAVRALEARNALLTGAVAALVAPDGLAAELFESVLADPGAQLWPFDLARVNLLYGERVRRSRAITRSRHHLQAALTAFELLGASTWADRAAAELAATAATRHWRETGHHEPLTAQELLVAELAATGLSNKQIGACLSMSHRTVSAHLYRIFPKLGIGSRAALRDALSRQGARPAVQRV
jgi:DNA-binding CsgD family transcriptional regulator